MKTLLVVAAMAALIGVPRAQATIEIRLINTAGGGDTGWITMAGDSVTFSGVVGNYSLNLTGAVSNDGINPLLDLSTLDVAGVANPGLLEIEAIANGYTDGSPGFELDAGGTSNLGAVGFSAYGGNSNLICAAGVNTCSPTNPPSAFPPALSLIGSLAFPSSPYSGTTGGHGSTVDPYSLAIVATIAGTGAKGQSASFDSSINSVPEPASVVLFGGVLLLSATALRKKLRKV